MKFRHEYKHFLNYSDYYSLRQKLKKVLNQDNYANEDGEYKIRSLYFDNYKDKALQEKINGINYREKFRIRCYNDEETFIRLEKKSKINGLTNKISTLLTKEETQKIIASDIQWMSESSDGLLIEFYSKMKSQLLRPKTIVDYVREPYVFRAGNVRITFDKEIRSGIFGIDFFNEQLPTIGIGDAAIILEVKYDTFLPDFIRDIIQTNRNMSCAFSKYAACRIY
ncbi:polyphosphate polymerase domain-containing protein [Anaerosacchariphilus polymeriproducens]|uniref:VTC domain-containing protein n=1 Tax=Anaerosacchariphilus polymeriproducens TaxID=1812858 RepID=A0A371AWQ4_9FIRM|nr:polyphosphate polymerase domain-containing protein [Anaerosacchariphilus polymeriproducens]RDU23969.1 VTC domain-containing protein [Anaerosacchariphilus polymeriproducens]